MARKKVIFGILLIVPTFFLLGLLMKLQDYNTWYFCLACPDSYLHYSLYSSNHGFIKLPKVDCRDSPPFLVLLITTTHGQKEARAAIRETWGKERLIQGKKVTSYFLLGLKKNESLKEKKDLAQESVTYNDIIQQNFSDSYHNLTFKTLMGMEWVTHFCPQTSYIMKTDTDMFVNIFYLVELLLRKNQTSNFFTGYLKMTDRPIRNVFSKWHISKEEYAGEKYPPFCSGTGYVFSVDVAQKIHNVSRSIPFIKLEDVYVGLCLDRLKIPLQNLHSKQTFHPSKPKFSVCTYRNLVTSHGVRPQEILLYWGALQKSGEEHC